MKKKILIVIAMLAALFSTPMGMVHVNAEDENRIVYISKTGSKYHYSSICSGMKNPRSVTLRENVFQKKFKNQEKHKSLEE